MFQTIRRRLLLSYLLTLGIVLAGFATAVRLMFVHNVSQQLHEKLIALGQGAASGLELKNGQVSLESDFPVQALQTQNQALEWFDLQGKTLGHQGRYVLTLPFVGQDATQIQAGRPRLQAVTLPVVESDGGRLLGYVRASQSLQEFDAAVRYLDWGMAGGIGISLVLSSVGGFLLTRQAMQPIEKSFAQLQQFTADASHELRSPLMAIQANAQVALKYAEGMRQGDAEKFGAIASATQQLTHLTEDLLFLARTDILPQANSKIVNLTDLLTHLIQLYQPQAIAQSIALQLNIIEAQYAVGDAAQLRRLFTNLLDNALRHTPAGGQVSVSSQLAESQLWIAVRDTGIGIAPDHVEKVFDRFWQADVSRSANVGGCGLGLAIVRAIAQAHGGIITVSSQVGQGSCFTVRLPAAWPT
jgi:two-component system, OmpR family, manganese sensing sensor histidine kinase